MPRVATKLTPLKAGGFSARKRIPEDVRDEYAKLYGTAWEERFNCEPCPVALARAKHREWLSEIEIRIANMRAARNGAEGRTLSPMQARALSGEWYHWFIARQPAQPDNALKLAAWSDALFGELSHLIREGSGDHVTQNMHEIWEAHPECREEIRPWIADRAETAQFLHAKRQILNSASRALFLDYVTLDLIQATDLMVNHARGDYSPDDYAAQFPKFEHSGDAGLTSWMLFERWVAETTPARATIDRWRGVFLKLAEDFPSRSASALLEEEAQAWTKGLISPERSPRTVRDVWMRAARTVFGWAVEQKLVPRNPFTSIKIRARETPKTREDKAFSPEEAKVILTAALAIKPQPRNATAVRRWVPWICAYTGARSGEITQLRKEDVFKEAGVWAIKITPEAGTVKTKQARKFPLHEHLIAQGFIEFVKSCAAGPLFYNPAPEQPTPTEITNPPKPRFVKARENLAQWVREIGVTDKELRPNHAWRDTFKQIAERHGIPERMHDAITGHRPKTVGRTYGVATLADKAEALKKFPRYQTGDTTKHQAAKGRGRKVEATSANRKQST